MTGRLAGLTAFLLLALCAVAGAADPFWHTALIATDNIDLQSASCSTPVLCIAVGDTGLAAVEDGSYQYLTVAGEDPEASLTSVSCVAGKRFCMTVDSKGGAIEWDGAFRDRVQVDGNKVFEQVSCPTDTFCKAIDDVGKVLTYSSGSWSAPVQLPGSFAQGTPRISCATAQFCVAIVQGTAGVAYYKFGGSSWSASATSIGTQADEAPRSLVCTAASFCLATTNKGSAAKLDGASTWTVKQVVKTAQGADLRQPLQAGCAGTVCQAIDQNVRGYSTTDGVTWTSPGTDLHGSTQLSVPSSVSCLAVDLCVATSGDLTSAFARSIIPTAKPTVSGTGKVGQTLTVTHPALDEGRAWFGTIWWRCDSPGSACVRVNETSSSTYAVTAIDAGKYIEARDDTGIGLDEDGSKFSGNRIFVSDPIQIEAPAVATVSPIPEPSATPSPSPQPTTKPAAAKLTGKVRTGKKAVAFVLKCAAACTGKVTLAKVGSARYKLAAGKTKRISITLSRKVRRKLRHHRKLKTTLTIAPTGGKAVKQKVTLRR